jgi:hypothetical protein
VARQREHLDRRTGFRQHLGGLEAIQVRHRDVHDDHVWVQRLRLPDRIGAVGRFADHFHVSLGIDHHLETLANGLMVFSEQYPQLAHEILLLTRASQAHVPPIAA